MELVLVSLKRNDGQDAGILSHASQTFTVDEAYHLFFGKSFQTQEDPDVRYIKMHGRKIYEFALKSCSCRYENCFR